MTKFKSNKDSNKKGSTLLTVVVVSCFAAILIAAVLGFVQRAHKNAFINYNSEQAYYIATSALDSIHDYLEKDGADYTTLLDMAKANGGAGSNGTIKLGDNTIEDIIPGGECTMSVSYMGSAYIKVAVTGKCNGQEKTINAYYSVVDNSVPAQIDNAIYANANITFQLSAENAGSITTKGDYQTSNDPHSKGSIITDGDFLVRTQYTWTDDPDGCGSFVVVGGSFNNNNPTKFLPSYSKVIEQNVSEYISIEDAFIPAAEYQMGTEAKVMDMYANTAYIGGVSGGDHYYDAKYTKNDCQVKIFGNLYCYKIENSADDDFGHTDDGDLIINGNSSSLNVTGNVFVEGDIVNRTQGNDRLVIKGTLFLSDDSEITTDAPIVCDAISYTTNTPAKVKDLISAGKVRIPKVPGGNDYYSATEFDTLISNAATDDAAKARLEEIVKNEAIIHTVSNSRNYKPSTDYNDYKRDYQTTAEFVENTDTVKNLYQNALVTGTHKISNFEQKLNDSYTGIEFDYVVNEKYCLIDNSQIDSIRGKEILVDMTQFTGDCVIVINTDNQSRTLEDVDIIVKNQIRNDDGSIATEAEGFCYIILAYDNDEDTTSTLQLKWVNIYDYCTYKNVVLDNKAINLSSYVGADDEVINDINTNQVYTPSLGRIYLMLNEGDRLDFPQNSSQYLIEAVLYAPGVDVTSVGSGHNGYNYVFDATKPDVISKFTNNKYVAFLGAMICNTYKDTSNTFAVAFSAPAPGSGVGASGSASKTKITFSHYESR